MSVEARVVRASFAETEEHYIHAWRRNPKKPAVAWPAYIGLVIAIGMLTPTILRDRAKGDHFWWIQVIVILLACVAIIWMVSSTRQRRALSKALRKTLVTPPTIGHFEFSDAGFLSAGRDGRSSFHPWTTVPEAFRFSDGVAIIFDAETNSYYWIPASAFTSEADYQTVIEIITAKVQQVHQKST